MKISVVSFFLSVTMIVLLTTKCTFALPTIPPTESIGNLLGRQSQEDLATPSSTVQLPQEHKTDTSKIEEKLTTVQPLFEPKGRSLIYENPLNTEMMVFAPIPENSDFTADYPEPILTYRPADSLNYDFAPDMSVGPTVMVPEPVDNFRTAHVIVYPTEDVGGNDMATAESNIVFRPLFTYRRQTAQRRRVYSRPTQSPSSSSNRNEQRGPQGYPYRYPSYGYPNYYPSYYHNAQFDHVA